ncbi:MAG: ComEC/Rec2 family competence protein [Candidatus Paceibacterota bacterium]
MNGILFGVDLKATKAFYQELKVVGLLHIVVLSGMNITMPSSVVGASTQHLGKKLSLFTSAVFIVAFVLFVGPQPPVVRAAVMGLLALVAVVYGRRAIALYTLFLSAVIIAIVWPQWISTVSFQLSFGATLGIILFGPKPSKPPDTRFAKFRREVKTELQTTLSAQVFTVPIIFHYFRQVSLISPFANVLVTWMIAPLMIFGFLAAFLGKIHMALGTIPAFISYGLLAYIVSVVNVLARVPFIFVQF